jgi:hypothetical protein
MTHDPDQHASLGEMYSDYFLDYASYVILERAVPHLYDGLKPVQRRILHAMDELDDGRYNKVAGIVGNTMNYHPHGDQSIGAAIVGLGQKDLLIDTQGNWGNTLPGDGAAAPVSLWQTLTQYTADHGGYTHQWQRAGFDHFGWSTLVMASADTAAQAELAQALSYRTFRVSIGLDKRVGEISCPASAESGKKTTCDNCMLCAGQMKAAKNIVIADHARGHARRVIPLQLVAA